MTAAPTRPFTEGRYAAAGQPPGPARSPRRAPAPAQRDPGRPAGWTARPAAPDGPRLLPATGPAPVDLAAHLSRHGPVPYRGAPRLLIGDIEAAGLTGRGGAAFPTCRKLSAVADCGAGPVVIGNGAEGEPASSKDKSLLWIAPHLVLDGLQLAAEAVGSRTVGLYVHRSSRLQRRLGEALAGRARAGLDRVPVRLIDAPPRFLAGEESALASRSEGGPALPRFKPPRVSQRGVAGRPTLVQNVETLAHIALIARYGAPWFRAAGTDAEPGTMLATLHRADGRTEVVETPIGAGLAALLGLAAGGQPGRAFPAPGRQHAANGCCRPGVAPSLPWPGAHPRPAGAVQAVLAGGYHGAWLPAADAACLNLSNASLRPRGAAIGAGVLAALPSDRCGLAETARVVGYLALESAGQCGPCFNGLPRIAGALEELAGPCPRPTTLASLERWSGLVERRGACHHPDGVVRLVRSALTVFGEEIARHARGRCGAASRAPFLPLPSRPALDDADWT